VLAIGMVSEQLGPSVAILIMAGFGLGRLSLVWTKLIKARAQRTQCTQDTKTRDAPQHTRKTAICGQKWTLTDECFSDTGRT
jgi:hypothetical protein